ncbi:ornithine carbamoyltransferase [Agrobacterium pusense]|uniref:ornithine carbamoyltransferase n=1 Tax=Agrobacterium pusense TaxID=648995 RepID=UPI0010BED687|nr:ornithine carbamoyltransferase [Agrobacterium pusense]MBW9078373.1 ornithine carbamoyltransferase [Agrobacterium pusense]MDH0116820.1 ornithine carbamoyltransferase [Agrobacterium pusense]QCL83177.1 ornithine carbamoyltransferase [Agrobacterium pusense]
MSFRPGRDFLEFHNLSADAIFSIIDRACALAEDWLQGTMPQTLKGKRVGLIVDDTGWRNTAAFDLGIQAMGGTCVTVPINFNGREEIADLAGYLDNWFDLLIIRTKELSTLRALAADMRAPVINARTKFNHPCETLGDLAYVKSLRGQTAGLKIVGVAPDANILRSWVEASISLPIQVTQVYPDQWHVTDAALINPNFRASTDMDELLDADVVITDSWPSHANHHLADYRISASLLDRMRSDVIFLPCPPVSRGQEVTADAMAHPACQSRSAKAFLLHAQNALMEFLLA